MDDGRWNGRSQDLHFFEVCNHLVIEAWTAGPKTSASDGRFMRVATCNSEVVKNHDERAGRLPQSPSARVSTDLQGIDGKNRSMDPLDLSFIGGRLGCIHQQDGPKFRIRRTTTPEGLKE